MSKLSERFLPSPIFQLLLLSPMAFFRQYIAPLLIVLVFLVALVATSSRIFLSEDMVAPAPIEGVSVLGQPEVDTVAGLPPALSALVKGLPDDPALLD